MREANVLRSVMALGVGVVRLFRNNVGALQDRGGQWIRYGVCNPGGSDILGWKSVTITPDMVGRKLAVFVALECKGDNGRLTIDQRLFLNAVTKAGGIGAEVRSDDDAREALS